MIEGEVVGNRNKRQRHTGLFGVLRAQGNVLLALMLRDVRTRFGSAPGFVLAIAWPLSHVMLLVIMNVAVGRTIPYGESAALWFATGVVPFIVFSYMARFIMYGIAHNRPLLTFNAVRMTDILFSRAIIEVLISGALILVLLLIFSFLEIEYYPHDIKQAFYALGASVLLGLGYGIINAVIAMFFIQWITIFSLIIIGLWLTSGVFFVPSAMPETVRWLIYFHPATHLIEWMREAYYDGYNSLVLDKQAILLYSVWLIFSGLLMERVFRGRMLIS